MPEPTEAGDSKPTDQTASTQSHDAADKQKTTTQPRAEESDNDSTKAMMDALGIDPAVREQIAPKAPEKEESGSQETRKEEPEGAASDTDALQSESEAEAQPEQPEGVADETDEEDEDGDEEPNNSQAQGKPDKRQKRINRLTRKKAELEGKLDLAQSELQKLRDQLAAKDEDGKEAGGAPALQPARQGRLSNIANEADLDKAVAEAEGWVDWCDANAEGVTQGEGENQKFIGPQDIAKIRRENEKVILLAPNRRQEIQKITSQRQQYDTIAQQAWPELFDKSSDEHKIGQTLEKTYPFLKDIPARNYAIGLLVEGMKSLHQRANGTPQKTNGNGSGVTKEVEKPKAIDPRAFEPRAPIAPSRPDTPTREVVPSSQKKFSQAMTDLVGGGGRDSLVAAVAALDESDTPNKPPSQRLVKS